MSPGYLVAVINFALSARGYAEHDIGALARFIGPPIDETFIELTGTDDPGDIVELVSLYRERYGDVGYSENVVYPGIADALSRLSDLNVRMGICTSKRRDFADKILRSFGLDSHFEFVSGGDVGIQKWQQIEHLRTSGLVSARSLMIGDRAVDVLAAARNGFPGAGVLWGYGNRSELEPAAPAYLFDCPEAMLRELTTP